MAVEEREFLDALLSCAQSGYLPLYIFTRRLLAYYIVFYLYYCVVTNYFKIVERSRFFGGGRITSGGRMTGDHVSCDAQPNLTSRRTQYFHVPTSLLHSGAPFLLDQDSGMDGIEDPFPRPFRSFVAKKVGQQRVNESPRLVCL